MSFYRCLANSYTLFPIGLDHHVESVKVEMSDDLANVISEAQTLFEIHKLIVWHREPLILFGDPPRRRHEIFIGSIGLSSEIDFSPVYQAPDDVEPFLQYSTNQIVYQHRKYQGDNRMGGYWRYM